MSKLIKFAGFLLVAFLISSCDLTKEPEITGTQLENMAGEWWLEVKDAHGAPYAPGYYLGATHNTAANNATDLIFDDHETWPCKIVCSVNLSGLSFSPATGLTNLSDGTLPVNLIEGKIIEDAATTTGGNKSDSLFLLLDIAGDTVQYVGYKRTGFLEDEH